RAVSGDLVVLKLLRRADETCITKVLTLQNREHLLCFLYQRLHGLIRVGLRIGTVLLEDRDQLFSLRKRVLAMTYQRALKGWVRGHLRDGEERIGELVLYASELLHLGVVQVLNGGDVHGAPLVVDDTKIISSLVT